MPTPKKPRKKVLKFDQTDEVRLDDKGQVDEVCVTSRVHLERMDSGTIHIVVDGVFGDRLDVVLTSKTAIHMTAENEQGGINVGFDTKPKTLQPWERSYYEG